MSRAGILRRLVAFVLDGIFVLLIVLLSAAAGWYYISPGATTGATAERVFWLVVQLLILAYLSFEAVAAASPAKMLLGLEIGDADGKKASPARLLNRWTGKWAFLLVGFIATAIQNTLLIWLFNFMGLITFIGCVAALDESRLAWHDMWAGTAVYRARDIPRPAAVFLLAATIAVHPCPVTAQVVDQGGDLIAEREQQVQVVQRPATAPAPLVRPPARAPAATGPATQPSEGPGERLPTTRPAKPALSPSPADVLAARKQIWTRFRDEYDKDSDANRSALGHKLLRLALSPGTDDVSRFAMLLETRDLATNAHDETLAMRAVDATTFFYDVDPLAEKFQSLSAGQWPDDTEEAARALMDDWLGLSDQAAAAGKFELAEAAAARAVRVARHWGEEQWVSSASHELSRVRQAREEQARLQAALKTLSVHPDNAQANLIVGGHAAAQGNWETALPLLKRSGDAVVKLAATKDPQNPKEAGGQIGLGEAWVAAAERQPPDVADAFRRRARHWYKSALPLLPDADRKAIRDRMRGLPGGSIFEAIADADPPRHVPPLGGKGGRAFSETAAAGSLLTGVRITVGPVYGNPCISSIQPLFHTASGRVEGAMRGKPQGNSMTIEARDGYAVAGFVMKTGWAVDGFKVVFMRINGEALDPTDRYESPWYGGRGGGAETPLGCDAKPVIGIEGRCGDGVDALGIVQVP